jgi:hypothetical protein
MFKGQLINVVPFGKADLRIVYKELIFISKHRLEPIVVPKGFLYDGASSKLFPKFGKKYDYAVVVHDLLCEEANKFIGKPEYAIKRKFADDVFLEIMELSGVSWMTRKTMYAGVRSWGNIVNWWN